MLIVGLTGNLGSGKSTIARIFSILKVPVYNADDVSKSFLTAPVVQEKIRVAFGTGVFLSDKEIDRRSLAKIVFGDARKLVTLNSILHPLVRDDFMKWCISNKKQPYVIQEAAIIFESGLKEEYDKIIHVSCPEETAIERVMRRDNSSCEEVLSRLQFSGILQKDRLQVHRRSIQAPAPVQCSSFLML